MFVSGISALVTGANRGIGRAFVDRLLARGASRVYAAVRDRRTLAELLARYGDAVQPLELDLRDASSVRRAAESAGEVRLVVNNAGVADMGGVTGRASYETARTAMEVNYFGLMEMLRAFAPVLERRAPSAFINVLSILAHVAMPRAATYGASKSAALAATRAARAELAPAQILVQALMPAYVDTDMTAGLAVAKAPAADVVDASLDALERGDEDVYPDGPSRQLRDAYFSDAKALEASFAALVAPRT